LLSISGCTGLIFAAPDYREPSFELTFLSDGLYRISPVKVHRAFRSRTARQFAIKRRRDQFADSPNVGNRCDVMLELLGDHFQWTSTGVDLFPKPARVVGLSEDGSDLRVHGSPTGIPTREVTVIEVPAFGRASNAYAGHDGELSVILKGNRLEITAGVYWVGLSRLKEILTRYEGILDLLEPNGSGAETGKR
jgi:hypothetical protein